MTVTISKICRRVEFRRLKIARFHASFVAKPLFELRAAPGQARYEAAAISERLNVEFRKWLRSHLLYVDEDRWCPHRPREKAADEERAFQSVLSKSQFTDKHRFQSARIIHGDRVSGAYRDSRLPARRVRRLDRPRKVSGGHTGLALSIRSARLRKIRPVAKRGGRLGKAPASRGRRREIQVPDFLLAFGNGFG